ncbi:MAG: GNAT family N-acetyltransferase [Candidatus Nanoarchaeia archaeon]
MVVAENEKEIMGYFLAKIEKAPIYITPKRIGVIYDAFVKEKYRRKGIGENLFKVVLDWFKKNKIKHVEVTADYRNKQAIQFLKKLNFKPYRLKLRRDI